MIKFQGYLPDIDQTTAGAIIDCKNLIPTTKGFKGAPLAASAGLSAVSDATDSIFVGTKLDGTVRVFAGTSATLEEAGTVSWSDRTRLVGGAYNCPNDDRWSFAQYGNYTLASNISDVIQYSQSTVFADITGSPQAKYIAVSEGFVMAVYTSTSGDQWHCSAYQDYTDWTESVATQCTSGRVVGGGYFTGVKAFGSNFVAWKKNSTYIARYVGAPVVFQWDEIPGDIGCPTSHAAVDIGDRIAFMGNDDFYIFDGANNIPIGEGIREWFFSQINPQQTHRAVATYNPISSSVTWHYCSNSNSSVNPDKAVVFNVRTRRWGKYDLSIECAATYYPAGLIYGETPGDGNIGDEWTTYDDLPTNISYDSPYWTAGVASSGVIQTDHILYTLTGVPGSSELTMNIIGDDELFTTLSRVTPRFIIAPTASILTHYTDDTYGGGFASHRTCNLSNGKYDLLASARWHKIHFAFFGPMEIVGVKPILVQDGEQ